MYLFTDLNYPFIVKALKKNIIIVLEINILEIPIVLHYRAQEGFKPSYW